MSPNHTTVSRRHPSMISRAVRGIIRRCKELRNTIEWSAVHAVRREAPWSRNRWGQRYQAVSLSEYHYLRDGNPETYESALIERTIRPGMTIVDVGANHGMFSLEAAHFIGGKGVIHAFEPTPSTRNLLLNNLAINNLAAVKVFPSAVGEALGTARLRVHREMSGLNTLADQEITWNRKPLSADEIIEVAITTLDAHAEAEGLDQIDFLKIDVEGFELGVIRGARGLLREKRVARIMLEVGDVTCDNAGIAPMEVLDELWSLGYQLHEISPNGEIADCIQAFPSSTFSANFFAVPAKG
ncbi:FkbM family methyltransferase [Singulisphaera acidiphila]|uniref:Methyltransferase, FkbM family n=1 Tax=Singulisphaera acidiphila (strain ATCC BAA-1392 / DSM 18658 / VKM B-2454 / MOB10) TaxID=886293 RepID=L0DPC2_SINAD|nr:FkbM family methyltransferase [Singulisphaera acidiphila]AGA31107.1 methyltransferase, FkbM family [Singulisphaera acidiphila DSM 18658]